MLRSIVAMADVPPNRDDHALLSLYHFNAGEPLEAATILIDAHRNWPDDVDLLKNIGICYSRGGAHQDAEPWLRKAADQFPDDANLHDALANVLYELGDCDTARAHGEQSLLLKDAVAAASPQPFDPRRVPIPAFDESRPERNVIAFSLWGNADRYLNGALTNAQLAAHVYPGWRCRFYVETQTSDRIVSALLTHGADVILMPRQRLQYEGLFWRFLAAFDPGVDRYLVRDVDSIINLRERLAVDEWLNSDRHFHILRDYHTHTDPILAGLWGGVGGAVPDVSTGFADYFGTNNKTANCDQKFLREIVWPIARQSSMIHDSHHAVLGAQPFPQGARLKANQHVGQDASVHAPAPAGRLRDVRTGADKLTRRRRFLFTITTGRSGTAYLTKLLQAADPQTECHHERIGFDRMGVHSPDASTFMLFNSQGNVPDVRDFWRRKFALIRHGTGERYVEVSHFLSKAGLIENLDLLGPDVEIDLIDLRRDVFSVVWSYANRFDFANNGFTWLFTLDPAYPRHIVDPAPLREHGMYGTCLWYVAEMLTRAEYYRQLLDGRANIKVHTVYLDDLIEPAGAQAFLKDVWLAAHSARIQLLPARTNRSRSWPLGEEAKAEVKELVETFDFDPAALAGKFINSGRRLA
jgi:hypothetical protein